MGLEQMTKLTNMASFKLRLTMRKFTGETRIETNTTFKVGNQVNLPNPIQNLTAFENRKAWAVLTILNKKVC